MAKLIPDFCRTTSPGEEILFEKFQNDSDLKDVVILHSLNIANHIRLPESEADFVCLIPNMGILVVEVKGHQKVSFKDGKWKYGNDEPVVRGPLQQAKEAMYSIRKYLAKNSISVNTIPMFYVAWFPKTTFEAPNSVEWESWQYLDIAHVPNAGKWIKDTMSSAIQHLEQTFGPQNNAEDFNEGMMARIATLLRPNFECQLSEKDLRSSRRQELVKFAADQFQVLDLLKENERFLVNGPAGTGKTLLALEQARRLRIQGFNPLVLCFNKNLSSLLSMENSDLRIQTISKVISDCAIANGEVQGSFDLNAVELAGPGQFNSFQAYDCLVIDEAQDLFTHRYLPWLSQILVGGLKDGKWFGFGDFDSQRLYGIQDGRVLLRELSNYASGNLGTNCRNTKVIGQYTTQIVPTAPKWSDFRRVENQIEPKIVYPGSQRNLWEVIDEAIHYFRKEKFSFDDIVIITPNSISNPSSEFLESEFSQKFVTYSSGSVGKIRFSTIHGFKGLESPCVILMELYNLAAMQDKEALKYVALTRATDRLFIISDFKSEKILEEYLNA